MPTLRAEESSSSSRGIHREVKELNLCLWMDHCAQIALKLLPLAKAHPTLSSEGILVGKRTFRDQSPQDLDSLGGSTSVESTASYFRNIYTFLPKHGHCGIQYRVGKYVLVSSLCSELSVLKITAIFATCSHSGYQAFIKGEQYPYKLSEEGEVEWHPYSDEPKIVPSSKSKFLHSTDSSGG